MSKLADQFAVAVCCAAYATGEDPIEAVGSAGVTKMKARLYAFFALKNKHPTIMAEDLATKLGAHDPQAMVAYAGIACRQKWWDRGIVLLAIDAIDRVQGGMPPGRAARMGRGARKVGKK